MDHNKRTLRGYIKNRFFEFNIHFNRSYYLEGNGTLVIGQDQDIKGGGFNSLQSFRGYIIDFVLRGELISEEEILKYANCSENLAIRNGKGIDFSRIESEFYSQGTEIERKQLEHRSCASDLSFFVFLSGLRTFHDSKHLCHSIGGVMYVPTNIEENDFLFNYTNSYKRKCENPFNDITWLGTFVNNSGKHFYHYATNEELPYNNERACSLYNMTEEMCVTFHGSNYDTPTWFGAWIVVPCSWKSCTVCFFATPKILHLRGLCRSSLFDRYYYFTEQNGTEFFIGKEYSFIEYVPPFINNNSVNEFGVWRMYRLDSPNSEGIMKLKFKNQYPIGRHTWRMKGDVCLETSVDLMLTVCNEKEFTCSDGSCVDINKRCNSEIDCVDRSDELDCLPLLLPPQYSNIIPPPRIMDKKPLKIAFFLDIYSIKSIDLKGYKFIAEVVLKMKWRDSRHKFKNLKELSRLNIIDIERDLQPWIPHYHFHGDENSTCDIKDLNYRLNIEKDSQPIEDDDEIVSRGKNETLI